jgi:glycerol dehydrogenase-like iron-containing ADH family enzyme
MIGEYTVQAGKKAMIIGGKTALSVSIDRISRSLQENHIDYLVNEFSTDVTKEQVEEFSLICKKEKCDVIIATGGGKAIDCGKWTADVNALPCITVPTCASTCACMVSLIIAYHTDGTAAGGLYAKESPFLCLADTGVIGAAPKRLIIAGIADTLSKWPETHYTMKGAPANAFNSLTSFLGRSTFDVLWRRTPDFLKNFSTNKPDENLDEILDTVFFMSAIIGNTAGHEYRLSVAHGIHDGLIAVKPETIHDFFHGEKVAYGTLLQMALLHDVSDNELIHYLKCFKEWGLPVSITAFGLENNSESIRELVNSTRLDPRIQTGPAAASADDITFAIKKIESLAKSV